MQINFIIAQAIAKGISMALLGVALLFIPAFTQAQEKVITKKQDEPSLRDSSASIAEDEAEMTEVEFIAALLLDSSVGIGIFESPDLDDQPRSLNNGIMPELEDGYMETALRFSFTKLNTLQTLRGNFDSLIFTPIPAFQTDREEPLQFLPFPGTQWLIFLQSSYNTEGQPRADWVIHMNKPKVKNYINPKTAYDVADPYHACFCLKWNFTYGRQQEANMADVIFVQDLQIIINTLKDLPSDNESPAYATALNLMQDQLQSAYGKNIGKEVRKRLVK